VEPTTEIVLQVPSSATAVSVATYLSTIGTPTVNDEGSRVGVEVHHLGDIEWNVGYGGNSVL